MVAKLTPEIIEKRKAEFLLRNIEMISLFTRARDKHTFRCLIDGYEWEATFDNINRGKGCPKCKPLKISKNVTSKPEKIKNLIATLTLRNIEMVSPYTKSSNRYDFRCLIKTCNHVWNIPFSAVATGTKSGCPKCSGRVIDIRGIINTIETTRGIKLLEPYKGMLTKHKFQCEKTNCNYTWSTEFANIYHKKCGCPKCAGFHKSEIEKSNVEAHRMLRNRLSGLFYKGNTPTKVYRDNEGVYNEIWNTMIPYWYEQYRLISSKPSGDWTLDHIIPVSWFDPYDIDQLKLCWNHQNFQWLSNADNISKNNRIRPQDLEVFTAWHYSVVKKASYRKPLPQLVA